MDIVMTCAFCGKTFNKKYDIERHSAAKRTCCEYIDRLEINLKILEYETKIKELDQINRHLLEATKHINNAITKSDRIEINGNNNVNNIDNSINTNNK